MDFVCSTQKSLLRLPAIIFISLLETNGKYSPQYFFQISFIMVVTNQDLSSVSLVADEVISKPSETSGFPIKTVYLRLSPTDERSVSCRYHVPRLHQLYNVCID
jgi:hypothetical protein